MSGGRFARGRKKPPIKLILLVLLNLALTVGAVASAIGLSNVKNTLCTQSAAEVWQGQSDMRFAQVTALLPHTGGVEFGDVFTFRRTLDQAMIDASLEAPENGSLYVDAWSGSTSLSVTTEKTTLTVPTVGVGGEWFLFHPLDLRSGNYLSERDYMQDRVILDEELAWALFGSYDVAGMDVLIDGRPYPVAGVICREKDFASEKAYADGPGMFMSYDALKALNEELKISCYELVMPDMISGYAEKLVREKFPLNGGEVVQNTGRYGFLRLMEVLGDFGERSMNTHGIIYPYWENAARLTEDYAAALQLALLVTAVCPVLTVTITAFLYARKGLLAAGSRSAAFLERKVEERKEKRYTKTGI